MADQTMSSITIDASPAEIMAVIADFPAYPDWTGQVKEAKVVQTGESGRAEQVRFVLDAGVIKDEYTLGYSWDDDREVRWTLVDEGTLMRALDGSYTLVPVSGGSPPRTDVTYRLTVDTKIPMLGMIKRKAEKVIVDTALKELARRVASQRSQGG
ncbi:MAG: SRPBCC family protein [Sporichthyaceae bacterium]|nr:SRPBCC family protein [Sporichthyaceae bacterium]